mmetsp:Transcript_2656/g.10193  ORF Transcript_2656/g.10193 Transcript_2656/m.10193 type:complete len:1108 (-) Transcript_2656:574-3897(-)
MSQHRTPNHITNNSSQVQHEVQYRNNASMPPSSIYTGMPAQYYAPRFNDTFVPSSPASVGSNGGQRVFVPSYATSFGHNSPMGSAGGPTANGFARAGNGYHVNSSSYQQHTGNSSDLRESPNSTGKRFGKYQNARGGAKKNSFDRGGHSNSPSSHASKKPYEKNKFNKSRSSNGSSNSSSSPTYSPPHLHGSQSKKSKKDFKKPEVPALPQMSEFERKLRRVRVLYGIGRYSPTNSDIAFPDQQQSSNGSPTSPTQQPPSPTNVNDLFEYLINATMRYKNQEKYNRKHAKGVSVDQVNLKLELAFCRDVFSHVFNILSISSNDVSLTKDTIAFLSDLSTKAESAVMRIPQVAGAFAHQQSGVTSQVLEGRWKQYSIPLPIWNSVPSLRCIFLPLDAQDGPQEIEIRPYPRTKKDLELFFEQRGSFRATNTAGGDNRISDANLQLQFFVVTRKRPVIAFRTSQGQTPFTKSNKLTEKWINDIRVKKFFGPVLLLKVLSHDAVTDEIEIEDYTMQDFDAQVNTNFSVEELIGIKTQLKQDFHYSKTASYAERHGVHDPTHSTNNATTKSRVVMKSPSTPVSNFELDAQSLQKMEDELRRISVYGSEDWTPFFRGVKTIKSQSSHESSPESPFRQQDTQQLFNGNAMFPFYTAPRTASSSPVQPESNLVLLLKNVLITSLANGGFVEQNGHYIINTNIPIAGKSKYNQLTEESVVFAVLSSSPESISSINSCVFGGPAVKNTAPFSHHKHGSLNSMDEYESYHSSSTQIVSGDNVRLMLELVQVGTWSQVCEKFIHGSPRQSKVEPPKFCTAYLAPLNMKKKNMTLMPRLAVHVASYPQQLPSRLTPLSAMELKYLFSAADLALERDFEEDNILLTPALIQNALKFLIPLQLTEDDPSFIDGAIVIERFGTNFVGTGICSCDEAYAAVRSISGNVELPWIHNFSSHVLTINKLDLSNSRSSDALQCKIHSVCSELKADILYLRVDAQSLEVQLMMRHISGPLQGHSLLESSRSAEQQYQYIKDGNESFLSAGMTNSSIPNGKSTTSTGGLDIRNEFNVPLRLYNEAASMLGHMLRGEGCLSVVCSVSSRKIRELNRSEFQRIQVGNHSQI